MKKFRCTVCGYVYEGDAAPEKCPLCKAPASKFVEVEEAQAGGPLVFADEHVIGVAKGCDDEMIKDLNNHFMGECTEVGMYLAMSRQADREGYPEVADAMLSVTWMLSGFNSFCRSPSMGYRHGVTFWADTTSDTVSMPEGR